MNEKEKQEYLKKKVNGPWFSRKIRIAFDKHEIVTAGDLANRTREDLLAINGLGKGSLQTIENYMIQAGLRLKMGDGSDLSSIDPGEYLIPKNWDGKVLDQYN